MTTEAIASPGNFLVRLNGRFGPNEARELQQVLASAPGSAHFTLDFTRVREYQDLAIGALADAMTSCAATVNLRGLAMHQRRVLRYLGVAENTPAPEIDARV